MSADAGMDRPYVIINAAMSVDGKISSISNDSRLSSQHDLARVHRLRSMVDAVMVGINTVLIDDPMLNVRYAVGSNPTRVVVDSHARIGLTSRIVSTCRSIPTIVAVSEQADHVRVERLRGMGVSVVIAGRDRVDLRMLLHRLSMMGIRRVLVEGGGELNWSLLKEALVDELIVTVVPIVLGGRAAKTLVEGEGFSGVDDARRLSLVGMERVDGTDEVVLHYRVQGSQS
ncbi:MAG: 2,5-diamino-6-(ribosylamino)-4(3H)-pyrimidinone 5'-phosphate reductase [Candidatus Nitrosocaldus sp.]|nr:2,5-diamino-6-(ribosylamino)-4(3H)-pyrimidinone 5'-phosphate reductase [Candidatus Nitrosocaldus sp.]MDW8275710.1 2,5-diamino-6-(ribosylamino)-4(3H)-pyrimidinone 5'-phosphate reductase [Candidatus Nitrosocaldus sp.]